MEEDWQDLRSRGQRCKGEPEDGFAGASRVSEVHGQSVFGKLALSHHALQLHRPGGSKPCADIESASGSAQRLITHYPRCRPLPGECPGSRGPPGRESTWTSRQAALLDAGARPDGETPQICAIISTPARRFPLYSQESGAAWTKGPLRRHRAPRQ